MTNLIEIKGVRHAYKTARGPLPVLLHSGCGYEP